MRFLERVKFAGGNVRLALIVINYVLRTFCHVIILNTIILNKI